MKYHSKTIFPSLAIMLTAMLSAFSLHAQQQISQTDAKGKVILTTFGNFHSAFSSVEGVEPVAAFELERAYLGYDYRLDEHWGAKVVYDMGKGDDESLQRVGYVKNAYVSYCCGALLVQAGLTNTRTFHTQEKAWGYRYVAKSFMDENKWASSADLGIMAEYKLADWLVADVSVFNGEGYKQLQADNQFLYGLGLTLTPLAGVQLRAYGDIKPTALDSLSNQALMALAVCYHNEKFSLGVEYNMMRNYNYLAGHTLRGLSLYASGRLGSSLSLYARYDKGTSADEKNIWSYSRDGQTLIAGLQWKVNKLFSLAPNFRVNYNDKTASTTYFATLSAKVSL